MRLALNITYVEYNVIVNLVKEKFHKTPITSTHFRAIIQKFKKSQAIVSNFQLSHSIMISR